MEAKRSYGVPGALKPGQHADLAIVRRLRPIHRRRGMPADWAPASFPLASLPTLPSVLRRWGPCPAPRHAFPALRLGSSRQCVSGSCEFPGLRQEVVDAPSGPCDIRFIEGLCRVLRFVWGHRGATRLPGRVRTFGVETARQTHQHVGGPGADARRPHPVAFLARPPGFVEGRAAPLDPRPDPPRPLRGL